MPGYPFDEVMAAGCFTEGSTIELSADAPCIEPYTLYMQGSLSFEYGRISIMMALNTHTVIYLFIHLLYIQEMTSSSRTETFSHSAQCLANLDS